jgi:hypothetical protein
MVASRNGTGVEGVLAPNGRPGWRYCRGRAGPPWSVSVAGTKHFVRGPSHLLLYHDVSACRNAVSRLGGLRKARGTAPNQLGLLTNPSRTRRPTGEMRGSKYWCRTYPHPRFPSLRPESMNRNRSGSGSLSPKRGISTAAFDPRHVHHPDVIVFPRGARPDPRELGQRAASCQP